VKIGGDGSGIIRRSDGGGATVLIEASLELLKCFEGERLDFHVWRLPRRFARQSIEQKGARATKEVVRRGKRAIRGGREGLMGA